MDTDLTLKQSGSPHRTWYYWSSSVGRFKARSWRNRSTTVAEIRSKNFFILNRPVGFVGLIPGKAVRITSIPTCRMLSDRSKRYRNWNRTHCCNNSQNREQVSVNHLACLGHEWGNRLRPFSPQGSNQNHIRSLTNMIPAWNQLDCVKWSCPSMDWKAIALQGMRETNRRKEWSNKRKPRQRQGFLTSFWECYLVSTPWRSPPHIFIVLLSWHCASDRQHLIDWHKIEWVDKCQAAYEG